MKKGMALVRSFLLVLIISLAVVFAGFRMFGRTVKADDIALGWMYSNGVLTITDKSAFGNDYLGWKASVNKDDVTSVIIVAGVDSIPDKAFEDMTGLQTVELSKDVRRIGSFAFINCTSLSSIDLSKVSYLGNDAFYNCKSLTSVNIESVKNIPESCFQYCEALTEVKVGGLESLGEQAFEGCINLKSFNTYGLLEIPAAAFYGCGNLQTIDLSSVRYIGDSAFYACSKMYSVSSLANATRIEQHAFTKCTALNEAVNLSNVSKIENDVFAYSGITEVIFGSDQEITIGQRAFYYCEKLTTITSGKIVAVENQGFRYCTSLSNIDLSHVKTIGDNGFGTCSNLKNVDLRSLESMGDSAFDKSGVKVITVSKTFTRGSNFPTNQITERYFIGSMGQDPERQNNEVLGDFYPNATLYYTEWDVGLYIDGKIEKYTVLKGEKYARPEDPVKDGFAFTGWYTDKSCTQLYDFDKVLTDTLILYAGWAQDIGSQVFKGYTVTLGGQIGVNFYTIMPDNAGKSDYILFSVEGLPGTQKITVGNSRTISINGTKYDVFDCFVPAKNMTSKITAELYIGGEKVADTDYSVRRYADQIFANPRMYVNAVPLIRAMLNYGAYAQLYFNFKTDDLANAGIDNSGYSINNVSFERPYDKTKTNLEGYLEFSGVSLSLESDTVLNLQFTKLIDKDLTYEFKLVENGKETTLPYEVSGDKFKVRIKGISADRLDQDFNIRIYVMDEPLASMYHLTYSPMTYAYNVIKREETDERNQALKNLMKALYIYNQAAIEYKKF